MVAAVLEATCRTNLLWSLAPLLTLNHLCIELMSASRRGIAGVSGVNISKWWKPWSLSCAWEGFRQTLSWWRECLHVGAAQILFRVQVESKRTARAAQRWFKVTLENKSSICAVGHNLKTNQNTTGLPWSLSLRDETRKLHCVQDQTRKLQPDCVQDQTPDIGQE